MTAPRVDWRKGGPEDGLAVIDVAPDPDPLHTDADTTGYHSEARRDDVGRPGMILVYLALAAMAVALAFAYWLATRPVPA